MRSKFRSTILFSSMVATLVVLIGTIIPGCSVILQTNQVCGGLINGIDGTISYKLGQTTLDDENCLWTIRVQNLTRIELQLLDDGFNDTCAGNSCVISVLNIYQFDQFGVELTKTQSLTHRNRIPYVFNTTMLYVQFTVYRPHSQWIGYRGSGFTLKYTGLGSIESVPSTWDLHYIDGEETGIYSYGLDPPYGRILFSYMIIPPQNTSTVLTMIAPIHVKQPSGYQSKFCYANVLSVYELSTSTPIRRLSYCRTELNNATITSPGPLIIATRVPVYGTISSFAFEWYSVPNEDDGCTVFC